MNSGRASPAPDKTGGKKLLKEQLSLQKYKTKDGRTRYTVQPIEDTLSFDKGFYVLIRALQMLKSHNDGAILVGLAGPSGSGKTAFSEKIKGFMPGVAVVSMDMYNDGTKVVDDNFDDPRLTDYETLLTNLKDLREGRATDIPIYDFRQSKRVGYRHQEVPESRVIVLEGIYALSERLRPLLDLRVSVTGGVHFDLVKRVMRDIHRSGQNPEGIIQQITDTVYPMFKAFIEPDLQMAQIKVQNAFNPFSGFMNATYILKSNKVPQLDDIREQLKAICTPAPGGMSPGMVPSTPPPAPILRETLDADILDIYLLPPNEDPETCSSWLRMRNREGRYSLMFEELVTEGPFIISPRISFEVNVRVLGGLMALGYEIGTVIRRSSTLLHAGAEDGANSGGITIKVDDVENLGKFVQILGKDRNVVAELGTRLGLDGTYIPRSYIEQMQLEQLTSDFHAVSAEVRHRLSHMPSGTEEGGSRASHQQLLDEILMNASPQGRMMVARSQSMPHTDEALLSSSAPEKTSSPIAIGFARHRAVAAAAAGSVGSRAGGISGLSSSVARDSTSGDAAPAEGAAGAAVSAAGVGAGGVAGAAGFDVERTPVRTSGGMHRVGSSGLLHQQLMAAAPIPAPPNAATPLHSRRPSKGDDIVNPYPSTLAHGHSAAAAAGSNGQGGAAAVAAAGAAAGVSLGNLARAVTKMEARMGNMDRSLEQYSSLKVQLDAMAEQYARTNEQLVSLTSAASALSDNLQALAAQQAAAAAAASHAADAQAEAQQQQQQQQQEPGVSAAAAASRCCWHRLLSNSGAAAPAAVGFAAGVCAAAVVAAVALKSGSGRGSGQAQ